MTTGVPISRAPTTDGSGEELIPSSRTSARRRCVDLTRLSDRLSHFSFPREGAAGRQSRKNPDNCRVSGCGASRSFLARGMHSFLVSGVKKQGQPSGGWMLGQSRFFSPSDAFDVLKFTAIS